MGQFEKFEEELISSYKSTLAVEAKEICKEIVSILSENDELLLEKALNYCNFCLYYKEDVMDGKLYERCKKYQNDMESYRRIKDIFKDISRWRKRV